MADLIQITIDVESNINRTRTDLDKLGGSVINNINTINRLESEIKMLNRQLDKGKISEAAYRKGMSQVNNELLVFQQRAAKAAEVEQRFGKTAATGGKSLNRFNMVLQQGGYQLQDFVVQLQSGTSFFTAFSQQGSQFASIFGPKGAVVGAIIALGSAIGGTLVAALMGGRKEVKSFEDAMDDLNDAFKDWQKSLETNAISEVTEEFGKTSKVLVSMQRELRNIAKVQALQNLDQAAKAIRETLNGWKADIAYVANLFETKTLSKETANLNYQTKELANSTLSVSERLDAAVKLFERLKEVGPYEELSADQQAFYEQLVLIIQKLELANELLSSDKTPKTGYENEFEGVMDFMNTTTVVTYANAMQQLSDAQIRYAKEQHQAQLEAERQHNKFINQQKAGQETLKKLTEDQQQAESDAIRVKAALHETYTNSRIAAEQKAENQAYTDAMLAIGNRQKEELRNAEELEQKRQDQLRVSNALQARFFQIRAAEEAEFEEQRKRNAMNYYMFAGQSMQEAADQQKELEAEKAAIEANRLIVVEAMNKAETKATADRIQEEKQLRADQLYVNDTMQSYYRNKQRAEFIKNLSEETEALVDQANQEIELNEQVDKEKRQAAIDTANFNFSLVEGTLEKIKGEIDPLTEAAEELGKRLKISFESALSILRDAGGTGFIDLIYEAYDAFDALSDIDLTLDEQLQLARVELQALKDGKDVEVELFLAGEKAKVLAAYETTKALALQTNNVLLLEKAHLAMLGAIAKIDELESIRAEIKLLEEQNRNAKKKIKNIQDTIDELEDEVELERKLLGLSKQRQREEEIYAQLVKENKDAQKQLSNDVLRAKAEEIAAAEAANEVYQQGIDFAMEMSNTFADFIVNGFKDFKSFVSSIGDMFKQLLAQMVAQALQTKIFLPITTAFLGGAGNAAAQSALGSVAGSAIGGSVGGGLLGSISGIAGGFFGGIGTGLQASLGLGGFASQGLFNVSANAAVATAAGASPIAATIGAAIPVLGAVAVVVGLFTKKVKELDNGLRVTIDGTETLVESYRRLKTTRLFGLISSKSTEYEEAGAETADPIIQAVADIQDSVVNMATGIGVGADAFNDFAYQFKVSLKDLSEEEAIAALQKEFEGVTEAMAELVPDLSSFSREGESLSQTLSRLYTDLSVVNNTFGLLGRSALDASMDMAAAASDLIAAAGGVNAYISKTQTLVDTLYDTQEQLDIYTNALGDTFGGTVPTKEEVKGILESGSLEELETLYGADTISTLTKIYDLQNQIAQEELARAEEAQRIADAAAAEAQRIADAAERERQRAEAEAQRERERAAAAAEAERQRVLNERLNLETRILQLQGNTAELRRRELAALDPSNRALQEMIYKLEDAKKAMSDLNEEDFSTLVDYQRAMARAAAEMNSVSIPTGGTGVSNPAMPITLPEERNDWRGRDPSGERERAKEREERREQRREQFEADMMTSMAALNKQAKRTADSLRKFDVDGLPAERT